MKLLKMLLLSTMVMLFTACGGGGGDSSVPPVVDDPQTIAIDKIKAYADDDTQPVPTIQDYEDAGVVGVTSENIDDVNEVVASLTADDVDTPEKIQQIVDDLGINILPTANAGPDISVEVNQAVTITGTGTDIDGTIVSYEWTKDSNVVATTASFDYTPTVVGTDTLTLTVTDDDGATASDNMNVLVTAAPVPDTTPPVITILGSNPETVIQDESYTDAGATALDDRDGDITANIIILNQVNTAILGTYNVTYDVNDSAGNVATQVIRIVNVVLNTIPIVTRWDEAQFDTGKFSSETFLIWDQSEYN